MADNSNNILNHLQQHSMQPPVGAFEKAWQAIAQAEMDVDAERKTFAQLQEHTIPAPGFDFNTITGIQTKKVTGIIPAVWLRAASVIFILGAASMLYFIVFNKKQNGQANYAGTTTKDVEPANKNNTDTAANSNTVTAATIPSTANTTAKAIQQKAIHSNITSASKKQGSVNTNNNSEGQLYDNDMLFTLVNYKNRNWKQFFTNAVTDKKITLNKYSYHNLTDKMVEMLQDIYLVKNNGKPTRKAKKTKRKFEKWRKKDEKYFDNNLQKNPADIIDLSEFILKNN